jgi:hypothetical protein
MDPSRCPQCKKRLMAMTDRTGRTKLVCLKCENVDPMKTDAVKWANSSLAAPAKIQGERPIVFGRSGLVSRGGTNLPLGEFPQDRLTGAHHGQRETIE